VRQGLLRIGRLRQPVPLLIRPVFDPLAQVYNAFSDSILRYGIYEFTTLVSMLLTYVLQRLSCA
jgi:hypothetical protein